MKRVASWTCLIAAALLGGCAIGLNEVGRVIDVARVAKVKIGETTKQEVLELFGPPTTLARVQGTTRFDAPPADGPAAGAGTPEDVYTWEYREEHEKFFTVLLYTYWGRSTLTDSLLLIFDELGKVKYLAFADKTDAEPPAPD